MDGLDVVRTGETLGFWDLGFAGVCVLKGTVENPRGNLGNVNDFHIALQGNLTEKKKRDL